MIRKLEPAEQEAVNKRAAERYAKKAEFERLRKYAPASILEATAALDNNNEKRASAQETRTMKRMNADFTNILKGEDVQDFEFGPDGLTKVPTPPTGKLDSPKPEDGKRPTQYPADSFLHGTSGDLVGVPTTPYDVRLQSMPGTAVPEINFAEPNEDDQMDEPAQFSPTTPGPIRMGNAYQFVSKRNRVSFSDVILPPEAK